MSIANTIAARCSNASISRILQSCLATGSYQQSLTSGAQEQHMTSVTQQHLTSVTE